MKSGTGSERLTRLAAAYLTSIAFGITFLVATLAGADGITVLRRSVVVGGCALIAAHLLAPPVVDVVLNALSRDEARRRAELAKEDDA